MTQRSIQAGPAPTVIVRAGGTVLVTGQEGERVLANTEGRWGLKVERRDNVIEVQIGRSGEVYVPFDSSVKVYAGQSTRVQHIAGSAAIYAGGDAYLRSVGSLTHASTGGALDVECDRAEGSAVECTAGRDLRCFIRDLRNVRLAISDLGGYWEGVIGGGHTKLRLKAGGDVILITDQHVTALPPHYILGTIERPPARDV